MLSQIRCYILLIMLTLLGVNRIRSQPCIVGNYQFYRQAQIDSFQILYPGCTEIEGSVDIRSDSGAITNLLGLSTLTSIKGNFRIFRNLLLKDLSGLNNLQSIEGNIYIGNNELLTDLTALSQLKYFGHFMSISNNPKLESLSGLDNIEFDLFDNLEITENPKLNYCHISSICEFITRYGYSYIYNNSPGCDYMEGIYQYCNPGPDSLAPYKELCFEDGFENWTITNDSLLPINWVIEDWGLWSSEGKLNVERVPNLNEGNYAILLRSNGPGSFEGPERTIIERKLCGLPSRVDIAFTYTCSGEGSCNVILGQAKDTIGGVNWRTIWNGHTWDTIKRTVVLNNIPVNPPFSGFQRIQFRTNPIYWTGGSYGISEFIIDSVVIREYSISTADQTPPESSAIFTVYPNPSHDIFYIQSNKLEKPDLITTYSMDGQILLQLYDDWKVDLSPFPPGMYLIEIRSNDQRNISKAVKI